GGGAQQPHRRLHRDARGVPSLDEGTWRRHREHHCRHLARLARLRPFRRGMLTLSETAACEWAVSGVRVNTVAPGGIASSGFDTYTPEAKAKILEYPPTVPLQRCGT